MKKRYLLFIALIYLFFGFTFQKDKSKEDFAPPGTVKVDSNLFYDVSEISNFEWLEYLLWLKDQYGADDEMYKWNLPDTSVWNKPLSYNDPYRIYYFRHPAYRNYPVVGISYEQVIGYCKWRTDRVRELLEKVKSEHPKTYIPKKFVYRLPTKEEWEIQVKIGYSDKIKKQLEHKYKGKKRYNMKERSGDSMGVAGSLNDNADVTAPVFSYWPNKNGIYNLIGNVAEMTSEEGIAVGGSWMHLYDEDDLEKDYTYDTPAAWLGFRCVCEIIEE